MVSGGFQISNSVSESVLRRHRRRVSNVIRNKAFDQIEPNRKQYIESTQRIIFQNKAVSTSQYKYDPSRSRQINQTRNFTSKAPIY